MAHPSSETHTEEAERHGPVGHTEHTAGTAAHTTATVVAVAFAVGGAVAALIPGFWFLAVPAGVVALVIAGPVRRSGPDAPGHRLARYAVIIGVAAVVLGVLNAVVAFGGFDYFTTASGPTELGSASGAPSSGA